MGRHPGGGGAVYRHFHYHAAGPDAPAAGGPGSRPQPAMAALLGDRRALQFLDNTPTYLVFLTTAGTLGFTSGIATSLGTVPEAFLSAISCGAVFMGANTYIGNAPNFMVKSISDENGVNMPSFFGYMLWSVGILIPVFLIDTLIFFL